MGKSYSKQEEKEVIITQNAVGSNDATAIRENHLYTNNILLSAILAIAGVLLLFFVYKYYKRCHKSWMRKELRTELFQRIRARVSGRSQRKAPHDEEDEV